MFQTLLKWLVSATIISVISIMLDACGGAPATKQPAQRLSRTTLPSIQVKALYPGADVETVLRSVAPLKDSIFHCAENMDHMSYTAGNDGSLIITAYFKPGTDMDQARLNISNIAAVTQGQLPAQVVQSGITVLKQDEPLVMAVDMYPEDTAQYDQAFLANYAASNIIPEMQRIPGVSHLIIIDRNKDSLMRIWLDNGHMATLHVTLKEVLAAIPASILEAVTEISYKNSKQYILKCKGAYHPPVEYGKIVIRANADTVLRLKDVTAKMEFGPYTYGNVTRITGKTGINIAVTQFPDSNYQAIQTAVKTLMEAASTKFPHGIKHSILYNPKDSLYISVE
jgi:HAE1 family hydrophobic/amphiphilic exporter-1